MEINAQDCQIREITSQECKEFCKDSFQSSLYNYGLFFNNELIQVMLFDFESVSQQSKIINYDFELIHICAKSDYHITNGESKLLNHFIEIKHPHNIVAHCSKDDRFKYENCGFTLLKDEGGKLTFELEVRPFTGYIYKTTNLVNGKIYIGQHHGEFLTSYIGSGVLLLKAIEKYGQDNFKVVVIETVTEKYYDDYQNKINDLEIYYINKFDATNHKVGYNILAGGQSNGMYFAQVKSFSNEEFKKVKSESAKIMWQSEEYKKKRHDGMMRVWTEEKRQKAAEVAKQKWEEEKKNGISRSKEKLQSEEYRKMMSSKMKELYKGKAGATKGKHWWTNGTDNVLSEKCPEGYHSGRCGLPPVSDETRAKLKVINKINKNKPESKEFHSKKQTA